MPIEVIQRKSLIGDNKFFDEELTELATRQGVPSLPKLSEFFTLVSTDHQRDIVAVGRFTGKNGLGKISKIFVSPDHTRQGYGRHIISLMEDFALKNGIKRIKATTETWAASKLFEHCGYTNLSQIPLEMDLQSKPGFQGGPQFEILFLKELNP